MFGKGGYGRGMAGDGSPLTTGTVVANASGGFNVNVAHSYADQGTYGSA